MGEDSFNEKCYEEDQVLDGTIYDTITIQCEVTKPLALLNICVADGIANEKLSVEDNAAFPSALKRKNASADSFEDLSNENICRRRKKQLIKGITIEVILTEMNNAYNN